MPQPSIFARLPKPVHSAFLKACQEERRAMTAQIVVVIEEWLAARAKAKKAE